MSVVPSNPEEALAFTSPSTKFLVGKEANVYGINFQEFRLRDMDSGTVLMEVSREEREALDRMMQEEAKARGEDDPTGEAEVI